MELGGGDQFQQLSPADKKRYREAALATIRLAQSYSIPIIFAPPVSRGGTINGASGAILELGNDRFLLTASHVLAGYEDRIRKGEVLNWQVGALPPFDPLERITWRSIERDLVFLRLTAPEARTACGTGSRVVPILSGWPPPRPTVGDAVLVAGFPRGLREVRAHWIGSGPLAAMFRVTNVRDGYCDCQIEDRDLISFDSEGLPSPDADMGGLSGGPVFSMGAAAITYPLVGLVTDLCRMTFAEFQLLRIATLDRIAESELLQR